MYGELIVVKKLIMLLMCHVHNKNLNPIKMNVVEVKFTISIML